MNYAMERSKYRYNELFPNEEIKAKAFDEIAERYYFANFGSTSKADLDVLMFSLYIEQILNISEDNPNTYSDYTLSKLLGITQSRISNLKVKKELQYPYENFTWQKSFERIMDNYRYDNGKIMLFIPDKNLYLELKNAIEEGGGYVEIVLNSTLLQITPEYYIDLLMAVSPEKEREEIITTVKSELSKHNIETSGLGKNSVGDIIRNSAPHIVVEVICCLIEACIPIVGKALGNTLKRLVMSIKNDCTAS